MTLSAASAWSIAFFGELYSRGLREVVVSPGSRSQALALAATHWERQTSGELRVSVVIDERSAAFRAIGIAAETGRPVVCVSTSGSAPGHYLPAVMEAYHSGLPLVLVSADRPEFERGIGSNQTTNQEGLYGIFADTESVNTSEVGKIKSAIKFARLIIDQSVFPPRPVHLNVAFREPLSGEFGPVGEVSKRKPAEVKSRALVSQTLEPGPHTLVIAGFGAGEEAEQTAVKIGAPLIAEALSGARYGPHLVLNYESVLAESEFLASIARIITFGRPTLSRLVWNLLSDSRIEQFVVRGKAPESPNPSGKATILDQLQVSRAASQKELSEWVKPWVVMGRKSHAALIDKLLPAAPELSALRSDKLARLRTFADKEMRVQRRPISRPELALALWEATWPHDRLILGSSRMVREVDRVVGPKKILVHSTRGLSGIDGLISFSRGVATGLSREGGMGVTRLILGDVSLLHDAGSLLQTPNEVPSGQIQIFVANDGGGSIFDSLEVKSTARPDDFDRVLFTPHTVNLRALAEAYGWEYMFAERAKDLADALSSNFQCVLVEIPLSRD